ncbi:putative membrane protein [[Clostridium] cellulosi]|uniref:Putative membrane protein n=1 Tax=[Clostridium] cellulosi TaxID=29343 RepID=A0A078KLP0_9FIRM|nr:putative membrane protein [[Clostridium] cellulosi]
MINNNNNNPEKDKNISAENSNSSSANAENQADIKSETEKVKASTENNNTKKTKEKNKIAFYKRRSFKYGSMATAFTAIFIAIIILINVGLTVASERVQLSVDLTNSKSYELSSETLNFLKKLKQPITIKFFATRSQMENADDQYFSGAVKLIQQYPKYSSNISIEYIDYEKNPTAVAAYQNENVNQYDIVVSAKDNSGKEIYKVINYSDLVVTQTNSTTYSQSIIGNQAEQQIDSAIDYVTSDYHPTVIFTQGHDEDDASAYQSLLKSANYEVSQSNIASKDIDKKASAIAIVNPKTDFSEAEIDRIDAFLKNDGNYGKSVFIYLDPRIQSLPKLEEYIAEWGVKVEKGAIYDSTNSFNNAFDPIASDVDSEITGIPSTTNIGTDVRISKPLTILYEQKNERKVKSIIKTGDSSKLLADITKSAADSDKDGPFTAMALSTWTSGSNKSNMVISGSFQILDSDVLNSTNKNNKNLILGMTNKLLGKQTSISVPSKYNSSSSLSLTIGQRYLTWILLVVIIPVAILLIGFVKWLRRRHL